MQQAPVMKSSGLAPIDDEPVHVFGRNLEARVIESKQKEVTPDKELEEKDKKRELEDDLESIKRRKFDAVTGEEDEETSFQGEFKLFIWDKSSSNWIEKGRGQLKLNDSLDSRQQRSRLIMRAGGTYRIILNVAIQHSFFKVIGNTKTSIRFTDSLNVWAASGSNAKQLGDLIEERLETAAEQAASSSDSRKDEGSKKDSEPTGDEPKPVCEGTPREEKDNRTIKTDQDTGEAPTPGLRGPSDVSDRSDVSNPAANLPQGDSNRAPSVKHNSDHHLHPNNEDQKDEIEQVHRKQQSKTNQNEEPKEDLHTEISKERHQLEQAKETDDVKEQTKRIKLGSS